MKGIRHKNGGMAEVGAPISQDGVAVIRIVGASACVIFILFQKIQKMTNNEENEWDHRILAGINEGPAQCIRIDEVAAALKKMKRQSSRLVRACSRNDMSQRIMI